MGRDAGRGARLVPISLHRQQTRGCGSNALMPEMMLPAPAWAAGRELCSPQPTGRSISRDRRRFSESSAVERDLLTISPLAQAVRA